MAPKKSADTKSITRSATTAKARKPAASVVFKKAAPQKKPAPSKKTGGTQKTGTRSREGKAATSPGAAASGTRKGSTRKTGRKGKGVVAPAAPAAPAPPAAPAVAAAPIGPVVEPQAAGFHGSIFMETENYSVVAPLADLNNIVHPLFAQLNFKTVPTDWTVMETPARLASRLLEAPALQPMFYTILNSHPVVQGEAVSDEELEDQVHEYAEADDIPDLTLTAAQTRLVNDGLTALAGMIGFVSSTEVDQGAVCDADATRSTDDHFLNGIGSTISYSSADYSRLVTMQGTNDWPLLRTTQFQWAIMLVHEVCHALINAREGDVEWEPFFYGKQVAEVGFEMEYRLFGGHVDNLYAGDATIRRYQENTAGQDNGSQLNGLMVTWQWPYKEIIAFYERQEHYIASRRDMPAMDLAWRVTLPYFTEKFTNAFWDNAGAADLSLLHPPKDVGYFFKKNKPSKPDAQYASKLIPQGYRIATIEDRGHPLVRR
ncbi:hypothetical protein LTR85_011737 [Meristemomyces frigidus]|nr:hypothetical protein LTR85_011737 [Meristemomyces frigidus]